MKEKTCSFITAELELTSLLQILSSILIKIIEHRIEVNRMLLSKKGHIMKNFNYSKLYDAVNISTVCNYLYKLIQVYEIDLKLIKFTQLKKIGTADIKDIEELTGFSNYKVRLLFNEPELNIIDSGNRLQVTVDDVRSFLQDDFNKKGKYWKALKSIESKQANYSDIIMMFNQFQSLINE